MTKIGLILAVVLSFAFGLLFTPLVRGMAARLRICEKPNGRTSRDIAHIGGVAIIGAILFTLIPLFLFFLPDGPIVRAFTPVLIASGFLVFLLGIIDDLRSLHYIYKLILQAAVSVFVAAVGLALLMHFGALRVAVYLVLPLFLAIAVWMLVVTTSFNLIDGIDGLASGLAFITAASFAVAGQLMGQPLVVAVSLVVCGATLSFLRYNFPPATIFMGDSGSLFLGLLFGLLSLLLVAPGEDSVLPDRRQRHDPRRAASRHGAGIRAAARYAPSGVRGGSSAYPSHAALPVPFDEEGRSASSGGYPPYSALSAFSRCGEASSPSAPRSRSPCLFLSSRFGRWCVSNCPERSRRRYSAAPASPPFRASRASVDPLASAAITFPIALFGML